MDLTTPAPLPQSCADAATIAAHAAITAVPIDDLADALLRASTGLPADDPTIVALRLGVIRLDWERREARR